MTRIESVTADECERALAYVLAPDNGDSPAARTHVQAFLKYMNACNLDWSAWRGGRRKHETAWLFVLYLPGNTAIAMFSPPTMATIHPRDQLEIVRAGLRSIAERKLYYTQALVAPEAREKREILHDAGFKHLTQLLYLQRGVSTPKSSSSQYGDAVWRSYSARTHAAFAQILLDTYQDSADCPELSDLRPIDAVIASHKASGLFDPDLWEIIEIDGEAAGCLLLSPHTQGALMEIVYLGTARRWRRRGVGGLLIRRSLESGRSIKMREVTAVVDIRNTPARQLYTRFGFKPTTARDAYIHIDD